MPESNGRNNLTNPIIVTIIVTVGLAVLAAFWQLSVPRNDIKTLRDDLRNNYLTIREHEEFIRRVTADLVRVEQENRDQNEHNATKAQLENHEKSDEMLSHERDKRLEQMQRQIDIPPRKESG